MESAKRGKSTSIFSVKSNNPPQPPPQRVVSTSSAGKGKGKGKEVGHTDLRALCPDRGNRDNRSIDQIQKDIKARKLGSGVKEVKQSRSPDKPSNSKPPRPGISSSSRRRPSPSPSTSTSSSEDEAPRKRVKPDDDRTKVSAMIQELFRRPGTGGQGGRKAVYSDSESDDMEAGLSDVEEEEARAIRIARREDELAEREERERKARKERLKREREGR
jgi:protein SPT2